MPRNPVIPYQPFLKELAGRRRKESTKWEVLLWKGIRNKALGVGFHPSLPLMQRRICNPSPYGLRICNPHQQHPVHGGGITNPLALLRVIANPALLFGVESLEELVGQLLQSDERGEHPPLSPFEGG